MKTMKQAILVFSAFFCITPIGIAQTKPDQFPTCWKMTWRPFFKISAGYPEMAGVGGSMIFGQDRMVIKGLRGQIRGLAASIEPGIGSLTARLGWADLDEFDFGLEGVSLDVVYSRPWGLHPGPKLDKNYLGPGVTFYGAWFHLSGAVLISTDGPRARVMPSASVGMFIPLR